jgi:hypothetical protein
MPSHLLSPLLRQSDNVQAPAPPSTPPNKKRRVDQTTPLRILSFEEEPNSSPAKLCELGLHVLLSPKRENNRNETPQEDRFGSVARRLDFTDAMEGNGNARVNENAIDHKDQRRESMYVTAFNTAIDTVIEREGHLLSEEEVDLIHVYHNLPCIPQLMISLSNS